MAGHQKEVKYLVDFDPTLAEIITETKYMEQLGFSVPELSRNVALQVRLTSLAYISVNLGTVVQFAPNGQTVIFKGF